jgi:hypothetical protein
MPVVPVAPFGPLGLFLSFLSGLPVAPLPLLLLGLDEAVAPVLPTAPLPFTAVLDSLLPVGPFKPSLLPVLALAILTVVTNSAAVINFNSLPFMIF